jgi:hypothetical protein
MGDERRGSRHRLATRVRWTFRCQQGQGSGGSGAAAQRRHCDSPARSGGWAGSGPPRGLVRERHGCVGTTGVPLSGCAATERGAACGHPCGSIEGPVTCGESSTFDCTLEGSFWIAPLLGSCRVRRTLIACRPCHRPKVDLKATALDPREQCTVSGEVRRGG